MAKKDQLTALILSLTAAEKKYFVQFSKLRKDEKSYMQLYKAILQNQEYNTTKLTTDLHTSKANLAHNKEYLTEIILKALRNFHDKTNEVELNNLMSDIAVLKEKKLYSMALNQIRKAEKIATKQSKAEHLWQIYNYESSIAPRLIAAPVYYDKEAECTQKMQEQVDFLKAYTGIQNVKWQVEKSYTESVYLRDKKGLLEAKKLIRHPLLRATYQNPLLQFLQADVLSLLYQQIYDKPQALAYARKEVDLIHRFPTETRIDTQNYFGIVYSLMSLLYSNRQFDELGKWLNKIKSRFYKNLPFDQPLLNQLFDAYSCSIYIGLYHTQIGRGNNKTKEAIHLLNETRKNEIQMAKILDQATWITIQFKAARLAHVLNDGEKTFYWLQKIIQESNPAIAADVQAPARMLFALEHALLGNLEILPHLVQSAFRYYKKHKQLNAVEQTTLNFVLKIGKFKNEMERKKAFLQLSREYDSLEKTEQGKRSFRMLDYRIWVKRCEEESASKNLSKNK